MKGTDVEKRRSGLQLLATLGLAIAHFLAGFTILLVSSWFIAACSIAGLGFNYMLPAVVIRALAIIRIASGYFSMLLGHGHLLGRLASVRLDIFKGLHNKVSVSRQESLDVLNHQSEEVAAIWMSWVGQNAGAFLSLLTLNVLAIVFLPQLFSTVYVFTAVFILIYGTLLMVMAVRSAELVVAKKTLQFEVVKHIEAAPLWHLYRDYSHHAPSVRGMQEVVAALQQRIRYAVLMLFVLSMISIAWLFMVHAETLGGNVLFIMLPIALLSVNDWLSPVLSNQKQLLGYIEAKRSIDASQRQLDTLDPLTGKILGVSVSRFKAVNTHMPTIDAQFEPNSINLVVGSSGVGKSRCLQALNGMLRFEGLRSVSLESHDHQQHKCVSQGLLVDMFYMEQTPYVLSDTLAENLRVADRNASDTQLLEALKAVGLEYLTDLQQWLGENGRPLSGGERKRLGMARALLSDASVLLLDEPFEALDQENIDRLVMLLHRLSSQKLIILTTHVFPKRLEYQQCLELEAV